MPIKMKLVFITSKVFWRIVLTFNMCIILIQWAAFLLLKFSNFTTSYKINSTSNNKKLCNRSWNNDSSHIRQTSPNERILLLPSEVYGEGRKEQLQRDTHTHTHSAAAFLKYFTVSPQYWIYSYAAYYFCISVSPAASSSP